MELIDTTLFKLLQAKVRNTIHPSTHHSPRVLPAPFEQSSTTVRCCSQEARSITLLPMLWSTPRHFFVFVCVSLVHVLFAARRLWHSHHTQHAEERQLPAGR
jgi:hypothetical protein